MLAFSVRSPQPSARFALGSGSGDAPDRTHPLLPSLALTRAGRSAIAEEGRSPLGWKRWSAEFLIELTPDLHQPLAVEALLIGRRQLAPSFDSGGHLRE